MTFLETEQKIFDYRRSLRNSDTLKESEELVDKLLIFLNEQLALREFEWNKSDEIIEILDGTLTFITDAELKKKLEIQKQDAESSLSVLSDEMVKIKEYITQYSYIKKSFDIFFKENKKKS